MLRQTTQALKLAVLIFGVISHPYLGSAQTETDQPDTATTAQNIFPSDLFTVFDFRQRTLRRVNLPKPDCSIRPSDCNDIDVLNTLDGFNLQPRIAIQFDSDIDPSSVVRDSILFVPISRRGPASRGEDGPIGVNQVVWDPASLTLFAEADELLDQGTHYALVVTRRILGTDGQPIERVSNRELIDAHEGSRGRRGAYLGELIAAEVQVVRSGIPRESIAGLSVFTTQSVTVFLEQVRRQLDAEDVAPADFSLGTNGEQTVFQLDEIAAITFNRQISTLPSFLEVDIPLALFGVRPGAVGRLAFGRYRSPDYRNDLQFIPQTPTRTGVPVPVAEREIMFNLALPAGTPPPGGWPVALLGHGFNDTKESLPFFSAVLAARGIATIAINVAGHGGGPLSTLDVNSISGGNTLLLSGGRGIDQNLDGSIEASEGLSASPLASERIISSRDGIRQTTIDLMQLVRVIQKGIDVDQDGSLELDPERIYYFGQSLGGIYGTLLLAVEPGIRAGVPNVPGGFLVDVARLSPLFRPLAGIELLSRIPSLINVVGPTGLEFDDNTPLRDQPPVVNDVPGAIAIQTVFENSQWVSNAGDPVTFAPHIRELPLEGVPAKPVIIQFAKGDGVVVNPTTSALVRAGNLTDRTTYLRNDLLFAADPETTPANPHLFLSDVLNPLLGIAAQVQIATFFESDGLVVIDPDGDGPIYEVPINGPLPEQLNLIAPPSTGFDPAP